MGKGHKIIRSEGNMKVRVIVNSAYRFTIPESIRGDITPGSILEFEADPKIRDKFTARVILK